MDVTSSNFKQLLPEIYAAIDDCDFVAVDTEFTGLRDGQEARITAFDTPEEYYLKLKNCTSEFLLIQVGLCTFKYNEDSDRYSHQAFNFHVFPQKVGRYGNDVTFLSQSSSIHFLSDTGFDFNKLFREGISYLNSATEKSLMEELTMRYENLAEPETFSKVRVPPELKSTVEDACARIEEFLSPSNEESEIIFERCNAFVRKLIFQTAYEKFSSKTFNLHTKSVNNNILLVAQKNKSKAEMEKENFERDKNEILEAVGFSKVIKHIADSKKLIVGHNMFLDTCHILNRFCQPLPGTYQDFKTAVHSLFPRIVDTKYICSKDPFKSLIKSSAVDHLIERLKKSPFDCIDIEASKAEFGYSMEQKKGHEAGFDAYLTGLAFISLVSYLLPSGSKKSSIHDPQVLQPFENKIFIMQIMDYSFLDLVREEPKPNRDHVFHITFPEKWRTKNIVKLFQPYGDVMIMWCNRTSAWISLHKPELADTVTEKLVHTRRANSAYTLLTWQEFSNASRAPASRPSTTVSRIRNIFRNESIAAMLTLLIALVLYFGRFWMER